MRETGRAMPEYGTSLYEMEVYGSRQLSTIIDAVVDERASDGAAYDLRGYRVEPDAPELSSQLRGNGSTAEPRPTTTKERSLAGTLLCYEVSPKISTEIDETGVRNALA